MKLKIKKARQKFDDKLEMRRDTKNEKKQEKRLAKLKKKSERVKKKQAKADAERIVAIMAKENNIDDEYAVEALKTAVEIMREPAQNRDRLTAARMVLDFTKTKPAAKSEVTIGKAEAFLESLLDSDEEEEQDGQET